MAPEHSISPVDQAAHDTVRDYKPDVARLAALLGISPSYLYNKTNPSIENQCLSLNEAVQLMAVTQDYRLLFAQAQVLGHVCLRLDDPAPTGDKELLNLYADWMSEQGLVSHEISESLAGPTITKDDIAAIRSAFDAQVRAGLTLLQRLEDIADD